MKNNRIVRNRINKRFIPNIFTMMNMFLGFTALILIINGDPMRAVWFVFFAGVLDAFDGKLARILQIESLFGTEFDSFADTISFCVTSSVLIYTTWVDGLHPIIAIVLSFIPLLFGTIRLAKFNLISNDKPNKLLYRINNSILCSDSIWILSLFESSVWNKRRSKNWLSNCNNFGFRND